MHLPKLSIQALFRPVGTCPCCGQAVCPTNFVGVGLGMTVALRLFRRFARREP